MMKVLVADADISGRTEVKKLLREAFGQVIYAEATNGLEALQRATAEAWDLAVLELALPVVNGLAVLKALHDQRPELPVIVLTVFTHHAFVRQCLRAGAAGFLGKPEGMNELVEAVRTVLSGGMFISDRVRIEAALSPLEDMDQENMAPTQPDSHHLAELEYWPTSRHP